MPRTASLGMYDSPALRGANDRFWSAIAGELRRLGLKDVPEALDRERELDEIWDDSDLLLAQTCGYPLVTQWKNRLRYVATPCYVSPGCEGALHRSRVVVSATGNRGVLSDYRGATLAVNDFASNSGMNLLRSLIAPLATNGRFFGRVIETGSHAASAALIVEGSADVAAIDAVTYAHLETEQSKITDRLTTIAWTLPAPCLPFVTSIRTSDRDVRALRKAIRAALHCDQSASIQALLLTGVEIIGLRRYSVIDALERRAIRAGYPVLA